MKGLILGHARTCRRLIFSTLFARGSSDAASGYQYCSNSFGLLLTSCTETVQIKSTTAALYVPPPAVIFYRAMLCIRGTSHGPVSGCPSVSPSVTSRSSTKTAKRRITQTTPHDSPGESNFLKPKISTKLDRDHPLRGRQMQVGWVKIGDFRQIAGYISKTVHDRRIVSIKVE